MNEINERISRTGIVPVLKLNHPERDAAALARALCAGDVPVAEVTFRAPGADRAIFLMKMVCPDMIVGAGTVTRTDQVDAALAAGGEFVVCPGFDGKIVAYCREKGIAVYPGCITPTEYHAALRAGLELIKFFPAQQAGGVARIAAMSAPFPQLKVMPTGGISLNNLGEYLACPAVAACGGSYMAPEQEIDRENWDEITRLCRLSRQMVKEARG